MGRYLASKAEVLRHELSHAFAIYTMGGAPRIDCIKVFPLIGDSIAWAGMVGWSPQENEFTPEQLALIYLAGPIGSWLSTGNQLVMVLDGEGSDRSKARGLVADRSELAGIEAQAYALISSNWEMINELAALFPPELIADSDWLLESISSFRSQEES